MEPEQMPEQGAVMDCVYCTLIYPDIGGDCPRCNGTGGGFREARMMDKGSSSGMVLDMLGSADLSCGGDREMLISILEKVVLYDFDIKDAIVRRIRDIDAL